MTPTTPKSAVLFDRIFIGLAIAGPILMVMGAGLLKPEGSRGTIIVAGHIFLAAILLLALLVRLAHGFAGARISAIRRRRVERAHVRAERPLETAHRQHRFG